MLLTKRMQVPKEYSNLPQLKGRAIVELIVKKADPNAQFDIQGLFRLCVALPLALSLSRAVFRARLLSLCLSLCVCVCGNACVRV
jgi:hypothetical protein